MSGNFGSEGQAQRFAGHLYAAIHILGSYINLERLDGVTADDDYDDALQRLDRSYTGSRPLMRSNNERITGVAMSPAVKRNGVIEAHLLWALLSNSLARWVQPTEQLRLNGRIPTLET